MKIINNEALLNQHLENNKIREHFQSTNLPFQLVSFEKGEFLSSPNKQLNHLLFVVEGQLNVFGIREDGSFFFVDHEGIGALLGDMEFCHKYSDTYFAEALKTTYCIALSIDDNREILENDPLFLRYLLNHVVNRLEYISQIDLSPQTLENKLIFYLTEIEPTHEIHGINPLLSKLHCSRRQLQRVIQELCQKGQLVKLKKGNYRLVR